MWRILVLILMTVNLSIAAGSSLIKINEGYDIDQLTSCVMRLANDGINFRNMSKHRDATVVNDVGYLKLSAFHNEENIRFLSRKFAWEPEYIYNDLYIITCKNYQELDCGINNMTTDPMWNPTADFIIVMQHLEMENLEKITFILRKYNVVYNVTILTQEDDDYAIYMYNLTSSNHCAQDYYLTLASRCSVYRDMSSLPFLKKSVVRNCNYKLITYNTWPYVNFDSKTKGMEQYIMHLFQRHSGVKLEVERASSTNRFGEIEEGLTIKLVQDIVRNKAEGVFGGLTVRPFYTGNFSYTYPWRIDHISFILRHAAMIRQWVGVSNDTQITFVLLALLFVSFCVGASTLTLFPRKEKDTIRDILMVFGYFLNKSMTRKTCPGWSRSVLAGSLLYASFIIPFALQTNMCSVTTQPLRSYEPQTVTEILNFQPLLNSESLEKSYFHNHINCGTKYNCLLSVLADRKYDKFTVMSDYHYFLYKYQLIDRFCNPALYRLKEPLRKIHRIFIFRRGSILLRPMNNFMLEVEATGILNKILDDIFDRQRKPCPPGRPPANVPIRLIELHPVFIILFSGYCLSALVFLCELRLGWRRKKWEH